MKNARHKKVAFIDRDGVINKKPSAHEYVTSPEEFTLNNGIIPVLQELHRRGFELIVITNQRGIARGLLSKETLARIHEKMRTLLHAQNIELLDILVCPHNENACECRKPKPGLLKQACRKYTIDRARSILISDTENDVTMGYNFGLAHSILVPPNVPEEAIKKLPKVRIAFIKFGGLSAGGSEKMLQIIAANLDKERFAVDYYYCNSAPYIGAPEYRHLDTDPFRRAYMETHGIRLVQFHVGAKDITTPTHIWGNTDFWERFNESTYDLIQTGLAGHKEYPFTKIKRTPILTTINLTAGVDNQYNVARVMHICNWSAKRWVHSGGDKHKVVIISLPVEMPEETASDLRSTLGLEGIRVYGMHQRPDNSIFSPLPLAAYARVEDDTTAFVMLGGGDAYKVQAKELGIRHIHFLPPTGDLGTICEFLKTLDVYTHGRKDGEVNSQAMAEAMYFGLPIVSHRSSVNNGHIECVGEAGVVVGEHDLEGYIAELRRLADDSVYYAYRSNAAKERFAQQYELTGQIRRIEAIYEDVLRDPFPHPIRRFLYSLHWTQNIRIWLKWVYLKLKYRKW